MIFEHSRGGAFKLSEGALAMMRLFQQHQAEDLEAGGFLIGRYIRGGMDLVVDHVTVPIPTDERSRFGFHRSEEHQAFLDEAWERSGGTSCFLGDWHTHAEPYPDPSTIDLANWRRTLEETIHDGQACFFVIVGTLEIRVWEGVKASGKIAPLLARGARAPLMTG